MNEVWIWDFVVFICSSIDHDELRNSLLLSIEVHIYIMDTLPMDPYRSLGHIFLPLERVLTFLVRIFFLPLPALGLWRAEVPACAEGMGFPCAVASAVSFGDADSCRGRGAEHGPGARGSHEGSPCYVLTDMLYVILKGQNNKDDLRKSCSIHTRCLSPLHGG